ncbi:MAG: flagellar hook-basal body complex protein [Candidatus Latescibacterota bacterium]|nr:flagellar hook-basal body complex protein [Candidatus Latescibacterota bacterium]
MLDSIYIGITGVSSHQTRMNVISNNISNVNTTGYKGERANFADVMSRTLSGGGPQRAQIAATNPSQSGLGVGIGSIDTVQQQGTLQMTGIETDLAVEGEGYFVVSDGDQRFFTRDGTFAFDTNGRLYDPGTGLVVQGNLTNGDGTFNSEVADLIIPLDRESEAIATTKIRISGNLDASSSGSGAPVWTGSTSFGLPARLTSSPNPGFPLDLTDLEDGGLMVRITSGTEETESMLNIPAKSYEDRLELVAELNSQISVNGALKNKVLFKTNELGELILRSVKGGDQVSIEVDNADPNVNVASRLGFTAGTVETGVRASDTDALNDLANIGADLTDGDVIRFTGVKPNGERFDGSFTYEEGVSDGADQLFAAVSNVYGSVNAGIDPETGQFILTDVNTQDRVVGFEINFSLLDSGIGSGIYGDQPPFEFSTNTQVYDEQGNPHSLTLNFTKGIVDNEWSWVATVDGITPAAGNNGRVVFNEDGTLRTFESSDQSSIVFQPGEGTPEMSIEIGADSTDRLGGLTQFVADSSVSVREQDGRTSGSLVSISFQPDGNVVGLFSNGTSENMARVSLASFGNADGLMRKGGNMFVQTEASGEAVVGAAESTVQGSIRSGQIEMSNVDLAAEFTNMIVTQRGFQASARSITTSDELLTEVVNLKR